MYILVLAIACVTCLATDARRAPQEPAPQKDPHIAALEQQIAGKEQLPAEQVFRNIQTFKGMPAITALRIMEQAFVPNLGVTCTIATSRSSGNPTRRQPRASPAACGPCAPSGRRT